MHRYFRIFVNHAHKPDNIWRNEIDVRPQNQQDTIYNILRGIERLGYLHNTQIKLLVYGQTLICHIFQDPIAFQSET